MYTGPFGAFFRQARMVARSSGLILRGNMRRSAFLGEAFLKFRHLGFVAFLSLFPLLLPLRDGLALGRGNQFVSSKSIDMGYYLGYPQQKETTYPEPKI